MPHRVTPFVIEARLPQTVQNMAKHLAKCLATKFCEGRPIFDHKADTSLVLCAGNAQQIATVNQYQEMIMQKLEHRIVAVYYETLNEEHLFED